MKVTIFKKLEKRESSCAGALFEASASIQGVSRAAGDVNSGARRVHSSAAELVKIAARLKETVGKFRV